MFYITGDTHGDFRRVSAFCRERQLTREDCLIILGDAGFNYYGDFRDRLVKHEMAQLPITIFCIHGNHEMRPWHVDSYRKTSWHGGAVWVEAAYPNLLFAVDGEIYDLDGRQTAVIGGAYSVDKIRRLMNHWRWWEDEQPSPEIKAAVEAALEKRGWQVDVVLSHTVPLKYEPVEVFLPGIDQSQVDKSTEEWLDTIEDRLQYRQWYAGHYHTEKQVERLTLLFTSILPFPSLP